MDNVETLVNDIVNSKYLNDLNRMIIFRFCYKIVDICR